MYGLLSEGGTGEAGGQQQPRCPELHRHLANVHEFPRERPEPGLRARYGAASVSERALMDEAPTGVRVLAYRGGDGVVGFLVVGLGVLVG
jgi:hypothetical protein